MTREGRDTLLIGKKEGAPEKGTQPALLKVVGGLVADLEAGHVVL
jgi:hypothetical protein